MELVKKESYLPIENFSFDQYIIEETDDRIVLGLPITMLPDWNEDNLAWIRKQYKEVEVEKRHNWGNYCQVTIHKKSLSSY